MGNRSDSAHVAAEFLEITEVNGDKLSLITDGDRFLLSSGCYDKMSNTLTPFVYWAQTESQVTLKVDLTDVKVRYVHMKGYTRPLYL